MNLDHYEQLDAPRDASHVELRKKYHELVLVYHPDKNTGPAGDSGQMVAKFQAIQDAWAILGDVEKRKDYDAQLSAQEAPEAAAQEVDLDDLEWDGAAQIFIHTCRCSDKIHISEDDLDKVSSCWIIHNSNVTHRLIKIPRLVLKKCNYKGETFSKYYPRNGKECEY